jgi:hypothetical protein
VPHDNQEITPAPSPDYSQAAEPIRSGAQETMRSKPQAVSCTKNAAQANDSPRRPEWRRGACTDDEPEPRFSALAERFPKRPNESALVAFMNNPGWHLGHPGTQGTQGT